MLNVSSLTTHPPMPTAQRGVTVSQKEFPPHLLTRMSVPASSGPSTAPLTLPTSTRPPLLSTPTVPAARPMAVAALGQAILSTTWALPFTEACSDSENEPGSTMQRCLHWPAPVLPSLTSLLPVLQSPWPVRLHHISQTCRHHLSQPHLPCHPLLGPGSQRLCRQRGSRLPRQGSRSPEPPHPTLHCLLGTGTS